MNQDIETFLTPLRKEIFYRKSGTKVYGWLFLCICGNSVCRTWSQYKALKVKSCGCIKFRNLKTKKDPKEVSINGLFNRFKQTTKRRKIETTLTIDNFKTLIFSNCSYCGIEPNSIYNVYKTNNNKNVAKYSNRHEKTEIQVNGIDRVDSKQGYHLHNVVSCCKTCNFAKNELELEHFKQWVNRIYNYINKL